MREITVALIRRLEREGSSDNCPQRRAGDAGGHDLATLSAVKTHIASLMSKLGARNRVEIAIWAHENRRIVGIVGAVSRDRKRSWGTAPKHPQKYFRGSAS